MTGTEPGQDDAMRRTRRAVLGGLVISIAGSIALLVAYWADGGPKGQGFGLAVAVGGLALSAGVWGRRAVPDRVAVEHRPPMRSTDHEREETAATAELGEAGLQRRRGLLALAGLAGASLLAAIASPLRSFGPSPFPDRRRTGWSAGRRLVDADRAPVKATDLDVGSMETVFPEGDDFKADSQVVLIRMSDGTLAGGDGSTGEAPGYVAYSKVCTHAGCPVGLYDADTHELFCPCHQSVFLADQGARPAFGPAARPLPQLPIGVDAEGYLVALGDFPEPIGPSFWSRS